MRPPSRHPWRTSPRTSAPFPLDPRVILSLSPWNCSEVRNLLPPLSRIIVFPPVLSLLKDPFFSFSLSLTLSFPSFSFERSRECLQNPKWKHRGPCRVFSATCSRAAPGPQHHQNLRRQPLPNLGCKYFIFLTCLPTFQLTPSCTTTPTILHPRGLQSYQLH